MNLVTPSKMVENSRYTVLLTIFLVKYNILYGKNEIRPKKMNIILHGFFGKVFVVKTTLIVIKSSFTVKRNEFSLVNRSFTY